MSDDKRASGMNRRAMLQKTVAAGALAWAAPAILSAPARAQGDCPCACDTIYLIKWNTGSTACDTPKNPTPTNICVMTFLSGCEGATYLDGCGLVQLNELTGTKVIITPSSGVRICSAAIKPGNDCVPISLEPEEGNTGRWVYTWGGANAISNFSIAFCYGGS